MLREEEVKRVVPDWIIIKCMRIRYDMIPCCLILLPGLWQALHLPILTNPVIRYQVRAGVALTASREYWSILETKILNENYDMQ